MNDPCLDPPPTAPFPLNFFRTVQSETEIAVRRGHVIVAWFARTFPEPVFIEREQRIEVAISRDGGNTFGPPIVVARVNPQAEPPGYNRGRGQILNAPYLAVDTGRDDGVVTEDERERRGFGNVYLTYFTGRTPFSPAPGDNPVPASAADILLSTSTNGGVTWNRPVRVNDDRTWTSHVFPSVQVNRSGQIFVTWIDRRVDPERNLPGDTWADLSSSQGRRTASDRRLTTVSTDWVTREDAAPDFGDYNSSDVIDFTTFLSIWADGRFPTPAPLTGNPPRRSASQSATPDSLMTVVDGGR